MTAPLRILVVCTANICRSPATVAILRRRLPARLGQTGIVVESAGVAAIDGYPACDLASALVGQYVARRYAGQPDTSPDAFLSQRETDTAVAHVSRRATTALVSQADLVLALDRTHRAELARLAPSARSRTFTLRQAARHAQSVSASLTGGMLPPGAPSLPAAPEDRFRWLVGELDAARGAPAAVAQAPRGAAAGPRWDWHDDDVPDPHVLGYQIHAMAIDSLEEAASLLCEAIVTVSGYLTTGVPSTSP